MPGSQKAGIGIGLVCVVAISVVSTVVWFGSGESPRPKTPEEAVNRFVLDSADPNASNEEKLKAYDALIQICEDERKRRETTPKAGK